MTPDRPTCGTCKFHHQRTEGSLYGECREGPPILRDARVVGEWALTDVIDWCGRHKPLPKPKETA
jgi:hypothetical protein